MGNLVSPQLKRRMADAIRVLAMDAVQAANSGHPGMPMGMADVATVLFSDFIKINPDDPNWPDRDRFVLSAGHGSMLHYALNHLLGYADMTVEQIRNFRQLGAITAGHPEYGMATGIETTTGPLGQGLATAVGMALAERIMAARFGATLADHRTWVVAGDGCLQEGISHEAIDLAGHLKLGRLTVLWDDNSISIDGGTELSTSMNQINRFRAAGWHVQSIDGHDHDAIDAAITAAMTTRKPSLIACRTVIGFGAPTLAGTAKTHGAPLGAEEITATRQALKWESEPFVIPADIAAAWADAGTRSHAAYQEWQSRHKASSKQKRFDACLAGDMPPQLMKAMQAYRQQLKAEAPKLATRQSSQTALEIINSETDMTVGGSADLTGSNLTKTATIAAITPGKFKGRYIYYGIREHGMAAAMNGMALHGGVIPYGGTFLVFSDYARGAMRLSALMKQRVIYVMTHDSIGLGEDGPTHQPIEHLAMLRATPNIFVFRPGDAVEVAEAWEAALMMKDAPSVLALSRQATPTLRCEDSNDNLTLKGGYVFRKDEAGKVGAGKERRDATIIATGTELALAVESAAALKEKHGLDVAVVSMPCWELFDRQDEAYKAQVLGDAPRLAVEAASGFGWEKYLGEKGVFIGMDGFGESAPARQLYEHFNITTAAIVASAVHLVQS
jgi:transketolase